jgi:hypothetical protein
VLLSDCKKAALGKYKTEDGLKSEIEKRKLAVCAHRHKCESFVLDASSSFSGSLQAEQRYLASRKPGAKPMKERPFLCQHV